MKFRGRKDFQHGSPPLATVLLVNLGTPEAPTTSAVRRFLAQFLSDPRVIEMPRWLWWLILHGIILRIRPRRSAQAYKKIWTERGSPLLFHTQDLAAGLDATLASTSQHLEVHTAMSYGQPGIESVLRSLMQRNLRRLLVLPLYPQYSGTTTASVFDAVSKELQTWRWLPEISFVTDYYAAPGYTDLLADSIVRYRKQHGSSAHLLFSFHGIPERYILNGDPYYCHCLVTARKVAEKLQLNATQWGVSFQSRVGRERWLQPYTDQALQQLAQSGVKSVDVICPAFAVDCLETLEEIAMGERERFLHHGGERLHYIPALNAEANHVEFLAGLIRSKTQHWPEWSASNAELDNEQQQQTSALYQKARAQFPGAPP